MNPPTTPSNTPETELMKSGRDAAYCNEIAQTLPSSTPETDAEIRSAGRLAQSTTVVLSSFARKLEHERDETKARIDGYHANMKCGACAEGICCGSVINSHDPDCVYTERDQLRAELSEAKEQLAAEQEGNWTASLCDRINELLREHPQAGIRECKNGQEASECVKWIHGYCGGLSIELTVNKDYVKQLQAERDSLQSQLAEANKLVKELERSVMADVNVQLINQLEALRKDKERLDWIEKHTFIRSDGVQWHMRFETPVGHPSEPEIRTAIDTAIQGGK